MPIPEGSLIVFTRNVPEGKNPKKRVTITLDEHTWHVREFRLPTKLDKKKDENGMQRVRLIGKHKIPLKEAENGPFDIGSIYLPDDLVQQADAGEIELRIIYDPRINLELGSDVYEKAAKLERDEDLRRSRAGLLPKKRLK